MFSGARLILAILCVWMGCSGSVCGQAFSSSTLPDAPEVQEAGPPSAPAPHRHHWSSSTIVLVALGAGEAVDSWGTYLNMTHPNELCGYNDYWGPGDYAVDNHVYSSSSGPGVGRVHAICGPSANYVMNVSLLDKSFTETGWTVQWGLVKDDRHYRSVETLNVAADLFGVALEEYAVHKKVPWLKKVAEAANIAHAGAHFDGGVGDLLFIRHHSAGRFFQGDTAAFEIAYPDPRWWGNAR